MMVITPKQRALRKIAKGTSAWEKTKAGLEKAMDVLRAVVEKRLGKIEKLERESNMLMDEIRKTENFIVNNDRIYDTPITIPEFEDE